jgi:hypothetical protein
MACSRYYHEFGFPLANIPRPDRAITPIDLWDTVWPLLEGTRVLLSALSVALQTNDVDQQQGSAALNLLEGHLETAMHLLNRWRETPQTPAGVEGETSA